MSNKDNNTSKKSLISNEAESPSSKNEEVTIKSDDKICIVGYSGAGKTVLMDYFLNNVVVNFPNVVVVDPVSKFSEKTNIRYKGVVKAINPHKNIVIYKLQTEDDLEELITKINDIDEEPVFLCVDEIDRFVRFNYMLPETSLFFQQGRNYKHGGLFSVRQVGLLNKQIFSNSHYLILFKVYNKNDILYLESVIPYKFVKLIPELQEHSFYLIDLHKSILIGEYKYDMKLKKLKKLREGINP